jgi:hypothetical protein
MATYPHVQQVFSDALRHSHEKMVTEVLGMFGLEERHFTPDERQVLQAFDPTPMAEVLVAAAERKLNERKSNAST